MGRPRKYVQQNGREITGVSKMPDGRFYIIVDGHRRQYFRDVFRARAAYLAQQHQNMSESDRAVLTAKAEVRRASAIEELKREPWYDHVRIEAPGSGFISEGDEGFFNYLETANAMADSAGVPQIEIQEHVGAMDVSARGPRLSQVLAEWQRLKKLGGDGRATSHIMGVSRIFNQFICVIGDVKIGQLASSQFRTWREWVLKESPKRESGKWSNDQHDSVKMVLRFVRRHDDDWDWPAGLSDWLEAYDRKAYQPKPENRQPIPASDFQRLIDAAKSWTDKDKDSLPTDTQSGRGQRRQVEAKQFVGRQFRAILLLGANCGLDPCDIPRITRENLKLTESIPFLDLPRTKVKHLTGAGIARQTPLLPATVAALRGIVACAPIEGPVFRSSQGKPFSTVSKTYRRLANDAGIARKWCFKHLRNIGPSIAKKTKLSKDEREAFLGHAVDGNSKFYEDDVDESYLVDLVNLIGEQYFGGERVGSKEVFCDS